MTGAAPRDVVVVLSWFGRTDTLACVRSLVAGSPAATVLVVDNGSFDGVLGEVAQLWPDVATLQLPTNGGFSGGMNAGIRWALDTGARTITILNNDTVVPPGAVADLADLALSGAVAVSPRVVFRDDPAAVWFGGATIDDATKLPRHLRADELPPVSQPYETTLLAGCCVTASAATWRLVGLLDEAWFLTFEDSEWSLRATSLGVRLLVDPSTTIAHAVSASFQGSASYLGLYYYSRNGLRFVRGAAHGSRRDAARFLRRHVVPLVAARSGHGRRDARESLRRAIVVAWALGSRAIDHGGPAPAPLQRLTARWVPRGPRRTP